MSLLLDALKKAAEQKARKNQQEKQPETTSTDVTDVRTTPEDASGIDQRVSRPPPPRDDARDQTQLNATEFDTRAEPGPYGDTQIESGDETRTEVEDLSRQMQTGEDETIVFADEDTSSFADASQPAGPLTDDGTLIHDTEIGDDETEIVSTTAYTDDTELDRSPLPIEPGGAPDRDDATEMITRSDAAADATELTRFDDDATRTELSPTDDTDISVPTRTASDIDAGFAGTESGSEETEVGQTVTTSDTEMTEGGADEDLSLLLAEREVTGFTGYTGTSVTDPQKPSDQLNALRGDEDLALVDTTRHRAPADGTVTEGSATATTRSADTLTGEGTTARVDSTSTQTTGATTRTYAPDNYDRTLMKLPSDDASRLFAGMKSDSDVVMTPDYAKKVFRSKSSAQRLHHYKLYAGIAFAILLAIGVYGLFEMQAESSRIESSLQPLKRDPMPGVIRPKTAEPAGITLPVAGVDDKTIALIESAGSQPEDGSGQSGVIAAEPEPTETVETPEAETSGSAAGDATATDTVMTGELGTAASDAAAAAGASGAALEIRTSSRIADKDKWLREAYEAYLAGDDARALKSYNRVLDVDPRNRNALLARAAINLQNGETAAAIADYRALLEANPKDSQAMSSLLAVANVSPQEAESQIKIMLREEPESPHLNFALANAYGAQNRWQEAQAHYFAALQNNPDDPNYAYNLAVSLEHIAKPKVAIAYYQRALENFDKGLATFSREVVDQRLETLRKL